MNDPRLRPGTKHCKCHACGEYFTTSRNFDLHCSSVRGKHVCLKPGHVVNGKGKARLRLNAAGLWSSAQGAYIPRT